MGKRKLREGLAEAATKANLQLVAVIYNRVSTAGHSHGRSVGEQNDTNHTEAENEGWQVGATYTDDDKSASRFSTKERIGWDLLRARLDAGDFHALILWEVSRGDRKLPGWISLLEKCRELGILIHITSHHTTYDVRKWRDYKTLTEEGVDATGESERTSGRILRNVRAQAEKGRPHGRLPYGYRRVYDVKSDGKRILVAQVPDTRSRTAFSSPCMTTHVFIKLETYTKAGIILELCTKASTGVTPLNIARSFNRRGILTSVYRTWGETSVRALAKSRTYIGRRTYQGDDFVKAEWDPIVPDKIHYACVIRLTTPARAEQHDTAIKHLLSGLARCAACASIVRVMPRRNTHVYACSPGAKGRSVHVSRRQDWVDAYVQISMFARLSSKDIRELLAEDATADTHLAALMADVTAKEILLNEARDACATGKLPLDGLIRMEAKLGPEIAKLWAQADMSRMGPALAGLVHDTPEEVEEAWWKRSITQRRAAIRAVTEGIEILQLGHVGRRPYLPTDSVRIIWRQPKNRGSQ